MKKLLTILATAVLFVLSVSCLAQRANYPGDVIAFNKVMSSANSGFAAKLIAASDVRVKYVGKLDTNTAFGKQVKAALGGSNVPFVYVNLNMKHRMSMLLGKNGAGFLSPGNMNNLWEFTAVKTGQHNNFKLDNTVLMHTKNGTFRAYVVDTGTDGTTRLIVDKSALPQDANTDGLQDLYMCAPFTGNTFSTERVTGKTRAMYRKTTDNLPNWQIVTCGANTGTCLPAATVRKTQ